jgi:hypothetical protein
MILPGETATLVEAKKPSILFSIGVAFGALVILLVQQ